jgi:hypothetical protein
MTIESNEVASGSDQDKDFISLGSAARSNGDPGEILQVVIHELNTYLKGRGGGDIVGRGQILTDAFRKRVAQQQGKQNKANAVRNHRKLVTFAEKAFRGKVSN